MTQWEEKHRWPWNEEMEQNVAPLFPPYLSTTVQLERDKEMDNSITSLSHAVETVDGETKTIFHVSLLLSQFFRSLDTIQLYLNIRLGCEKLCCTLCHLQKSATKQFCCRETGQT